MADIYAVSSNSNLGYPVEINISCTELISLDITSKSDPMVVMFFRNGAGKWEELGRTEMLKNNKNPRFDTVITVKYLFEENQPARFIVYDVDNAEKAKNLKGCDKIGKVKTTIAEIVGAPKSERSFQILNEKHPNRNNGLLNLKANPVAAGNWFIDCHFEASNLDKKDFFGKSDPYFVINRSNDQHGSAFSTTVIKSDVIKNNLNPKWQPVSIPINRLCNNDPNWPFMVQVWDWDSDGKHDLIGQFTTNLNELKSKREFELIEPAIKANKGAKYKNSGVLKLANFREYEIPSFLDYVTSGTEISLMVGIDYTGSNGNPAQPSSLHFINPQGVNQYIMAIRTVGDIVAPYDNDRLIPAYGFGASLHHQKGMTNFCFAVNFNEQQTECLGIDGVLAAYRNSFAHLSLSGPTNFTPILQSVCHKAAQHRNGEKYIVLLMLTDGEISDLENTVQQLRTASDLPISIIIVGVGDADFDQMKVLDDDDGQLKLKRDCVQFVPFRNYNGRPLAQLAKDVLAEVPKQLVTYMTQHNIKPRSPKWQQH